MDIDLEFIEGELRAAFTGAADSEQGGIEYAGETLLRMEDWVKENRPRKVRLDFNGLSFIDGATFRKIAGELERLRTSVPVELAGPGPALDRLFGLIGQPSGWAWSKGESAASRSRKAAAVQEIFEIDLDRELLLLASEPPRPEWNHMAEPLVFREGLWDEGPAVEEPPVETACIEGEPAEAEAEHAGDLAGDDPEEVLECHVVPDLEAGKDLLEEEGRPPEPSGPAEDGGEGPERHHAPGTVRDPSSPPRQREEELKERLIEAIQTEDSLRQRLTDLEAEIAAAPPSGRIPEFLRCDVPRERFVRAYAAILEMNRSTGAVPGPALLRIRSALAASVRHAPFAMFDFGDAPTVVDPAAHAIYTTSMAISMALRARAQPSRLSGLALGGLLLPLFSSPEEAPSTEEAVRAFAPRLHRKLLRLGKDLLHQAPHLSEVREDLRLLSLAREFWRRIGPGPEGGAEPASAAIALARGEIAPEAPVRLRRLFLDTFSLIPPGTWVRLDSGEIGVAVAPGSGNVGCPLVLSLLAGGEREVHVRPPRLVDTGLNRRHRVRAVVRCPMAKCEAPRPVLRTGGGCSEEKLKVAENIREDQWQGPF